ncbi:MAG: pre-peptidase C-terminal domain-containing protein [Lyngbya sp.]|nr:pre-peptidase C-terminal domain-containing protein [Lyngbya sp.]
MGWWDSVRSGFNSVVDSVSDVGSSIVDSIVDIGDTIVDNTVDVASYLVDTVGSVTSGTLDVTGDVLEVVFETIGLEDWGNEIDNTLNATGEDLEYLNNLIGDLAITATERAANIVLQTPDRVLEFGDSFFDDFWNDEEGIGVGFTDWLLDNTINALEVSGIPEIVETGADLLKLTTTRSLTDREIDMGQSVFGDSIDYSLVRIDEWAFTATEEVQSIFDDETNEDRPYVMFNTINTWGPLDDTTLIHELTHIWQYQVEYGADYAPLALQAQKSEGYNYGGVSELEKRMNEGQRITSFNLEQQGDIVADYYRLRDVDETGFTNEYEHSVTPNDLPTYAYFVDQVSTLSQEELAPSNESSLGTLTSGVDGSRLGTLGSSNPSDIYSFTLDTASSLQVTLQGLSDDADIEIRDSVGNVVGSGINSGPTSENFQLELAAGDYVVEVKSFNNAETGYDLVLTATSTSGLPLNGNTVSFTTPSPDDTNGGDLVEGSTSFERNSNGEYLFSNGDDIESVPAGETKILALSGNDNITGSDVAEWFNGNQGADTINGGGGTDEMYGGKGSDELHGDGDRDEMYGNFNNDVLMGGEGDDILFGGKEDDILFGGGGNDLLSGDKGSDMLTGDAGNDTFVLPGTDAAATTQTEADVIMDFENGDEIMLPEGFQFNDLNLNSVNLQIDTDPASQSTSIELGGNFLAIVRGVTPDQLTQADFVQFDRSGFSV